MSRFDGSSGRKPSAEARRYVYGVLATVIELDSRWFVEPSDESLDEFDRRRVRVAMKLVRAEMQRKAAR